MAGEQSCGTFARVDGERRSWASAPPPRSSRSRCSTRSPRQPARLARPVKPRALAARAYAMSFPVANVGANLPTLAATVAGNLYDSAR